MYHRTPYAVSGNALTVLVGSQADGSQGFAETFLDTGLLLFPVEQGGKSVVVAVFGILRRHTVLYVLTKKEDREKKIGCKDNNKDGIRGLLTNGFQRWVDLKSSPLLSEKGNG